MTSPLGHGALDLDELGPVGGRRLRPTDPARVVVRVTRAMWIRDRALAEMRWAALTLVAMGGLALFATVVDPGDEQFHRAIVLFLPAVAVAVALGWTPAAAPIARHALVRRATGPIVVGLAIVAAAPMDLLTLAIPAAGPFVVLALSYAAITPGYPIAAGLVIVAAVSVAVRHGQLLASTTLPDLVSDEFGIQVAVLLLSATGMHLVVRIATEAEARTARLAERRRRRVDDLEAVGRILQRFDGRRPIREVTQAVTDDLSRTFEIPLISIYLPDPDGRLSMVGVAGYHSPFHVIEVGIGVIGRAASERQTQYVPDVLADPDYRAARDDVRNEVAVPVLLDDELIGVVNFEGTQAQPLGTRHIALAEMVSRTMAASLRQARQDEERRERLHAIERVLEVSRGLVGDLDRTRTVQAVIDAAEDLLGADSVAIAMRRLDGRYVIEEERPSRDTDGRLLNESDDLAAMQAITTGAAVIRSDDRSTLALPVRIDDLVAAVLIATRPATASSFNALDARVAELLGTQVAVALRNAERHASVSDAAVRDPLTGLLNRRYFDEAVETAFAGARRSSTPLSLIVLDLDRFSTVNNEHGHAIGDAVLRRVAAAMADAVRADDTVVRYGGEEFVVIAPGTDGPTAVVVAERIRAAVAASAAAVAGGESGGSDVAITVSAGVASLLGDELDGKALFRAADSALLAAKRAGRDRVVAV